MRTLASEALILRSVDFGESDQILHLLTPEAGRVTAIAKGAKRSVRRFAGNLDLFNHLKVQLVRRRPQNMARLDQAQLIQSFEGLRTNPRRFGLACYLLELLDRLSPEGGARRDCERLFGFALDALRCVESQGADLRWRILLELRALDALGLRPELRRCVRCGDELQAGRVSFAIAEGGVLCSRCTPQSAEAMPVQLGTLRALEQGLRLEFERLERLALGPRILAEAQRVARRFLRFHAGIELRSEAFVDQLFAERAPGAVDTAPGSGKYSRASQSPA